MIHGPLPSLEPLKTGPAAPVGGLPANLEVDFDASTLLVGLGFSAPQTTLHATFPSVIGFRRLEGAALERFRQTGSDNPGWLWRVSGGGWRGEAGVADGLLQGETPAISEYLILGTDEGVNVLCCGTPQVFQPRP